MRFRLSMATALASCLILSALPANAAQDPQESAASIIGTISENAGIDGTANDLLHDLDTSAMQNVDGTLHLELDGENIVKLGMDASEPANITIDGDTVGITPVLQPSADDTWVEQEEGFATVNGGEAFELVRALKSDGTVQFATIMEDATAPERFEYKLDLPEGSRLHEVGDAILVFNNEEELLGGFTPPWAKDAKGQDVPTSYEISGDTLVQIVPHHNIDGLEYPLVADPAYVNGMIKRVNHERWNKGGWEVQIEVTALARYTWLHNPGLVSQLGYIDLVEHHPRSMKIDTMRQQWDCHVTGLFGTFKIDLESYRKSKPSWRKTEILAGVKNAVKKKDARAVARACNW